MKASKGKQCAQIKAEGISAPGMGGSKWRWPLHVTSPYINGDGDGDKDRDRKLCNCAYLRQEGGRRSLCKSIYYWIPLSITYAEAV